MAKRMGPLAAGIAGILVIVFLLPAPLANGIIITANSDPIPFTPQLTLPSSVPDFYAQGTSSGYDLKITSKGGYLSDGQTSIFFTPWGYVTTQWSVGTVYIIFLANITASDFYVGYLYVSNSSSPAILRTFHYDSGTLNMMTFDGTHYVTTHFVAIPPQNIPRLDISPEAKTNNQLSAIGPEIYLNGNSGKMLNGSATLDIYPLMNQLYQETTAYDEVWSLLVDGLGNSYFAILYMQNGDHGHVIMAHAVRLNDLLTVDDKTFSAIWTNELFRYPLTITLPVANATVKVNGFPFQVEKAGVSFASVYVPAGNMSVEVPNTIQSGPGTQVTFSSWENHGNQNPLPLDVGSPVDLTAQYKTQYRLSVTAPQGEAQGSGWYDAGSNSTFSTTGLINFDNGTRRVFERWSGDYTGNTQSGSVMMSAPKQIVAVYQTQYRVGLRLAGAPNDASATIIVNGMPYSVNGSRPTELWEDENAKLNLQVQTAQILGANANYNFAGFQINNQLVSSPVVIAKPTIVAITYSMTAKVQSTIQFKASQAMDSSGYSVSISGSVNPAISQAVVNLSYSTDRVTWQPIGSITANQDGTFVYTWRPSNPGSYFIKAAWLGDTNHLPASQETSVDVRGISLPSSGPFGDIVSNFAAETRKLPVIAPLLELATALILFGVALAGLLLPGGSPVIGYFIGSLLVGFVFVFPLSAIVLSVKSARSHRSPSVVWLTPLATIWLAAMGILIFAGASLPSGLIEASVILLIASNVLVIPLALSLALARTIAR
jgi:hypothetical protein